VIQRRWFLFLWIGLLPACRETNPHLPVVVLDGLMEGLNKRDVGEVMSLVDIRYQDDVGGRGRLEDDLRQLITVYGRLNVQFSDQHQSEKGTIGNATVEGKALRFEGPMCIQLSSGPDGLFVASGVLTDLRGVQRMLRDRRLALESGSAEKMEELISAEYRGVQGGKKELLDRLRRDFAEAKGTAILGKDLDIRTNGEEAEVRQSFLIVTKVGSNASEDLLREKLKLRREGTRWRIVAGLN
jgi:hypothetical protein